MEGGGRPRRPCRAVWVWPWALTGRVFPSCFISLSFGPLVCNVQNPALASGIPGPSIRGACG